MRMRSLWNVTLQAARDWWEDNCLRLAASLAYYTALSLAPLILLLVGVLGVVLDRQQVASQLESQLEGLMGPAGRELVTSILTTTSPEGGAFATVVGLITLFIGATAVFGELQTTMNLIWEVRPAPTDGVWAGIWAWLRERVFSLAIVFALAFLLLVSLVVSAALAGAAALLWGPEQTFLSRLLELAVSLAVLTLGFALLFKYVPDAEVRWRDVWLGGFATAVLFTLGKTAIGYYLGQASVGSAYGAAGSMVVLLVWVYYSALIVFFGAEFTQAWATRQGGVAPQPHAVAGAAPQTKGEAAAERPPGA
ncbi:MAG TPA: YihY/virulence factor BrkB family protein [Candidatus Tectomicrobia bacterium]|nr:YihY/virulence factor BrkB family protein [Candidatus Tectomicrobia bacterium]